MTNDQLKDLLPGCPDVTSKAPGLRAWVTGTNGTICASCSARLMGRGIGGVFVNASVLYEAFPGEPLKSTCSVCEKGV